MRGEGCGEKAARVARASRGIDRGKAGATRVVSAALRIPAISALTLFSALSASSARKLNPGFLR
jgi:hypothetical protein